MRFLQILILVITTSFTSCNKNEENNINPENSIIGTWQLIERFDGGSPTPIQNIENGEIIEFNLDLTYSNNTFSCDGSYIINNSNIDILVPCISSDNLTYTFSFENKYLLMTSIPSTCDEGCYDKYKRLNSE